MDMFSKQTKISIERKTRSLLNQMLSSNLRGTSLTKITKDDPNWNFFMALFERHPDSVEKIGCGIDYILLSRNFGGYPHLEIIRLDGSQESISWKTCCKAKRPSEKTNLARQYRREIAPDIINFKNKMAFESTCASCQIAEEECALEVDHYGEFEFKDIVDLFIKNNEKSSFIDFHRKYAKLQLLCKKCHLSKSKIFTSKILTTKSSTF